MTRKKNFKVLFISIGVLSLVIVITLIYAGFTGQLNITGTAVGRDSNWDIHFENVSSITTTETANNHVNKYTNESVGQLLIEAVIAK